MLESMTVPNEITTNPAWRRAVERANEWIAGQLGRWIEGKRFIWRVDSAVDRPSFDLLIETDTGAVSGRFDWFDVNDERRFKWKLNDLWDNLLDQVLRFEIEDLKRLREEWRKEDAVAAQN